MDTGRADFYIGKVGGVIAMIALAYALSSF
jgi:hypothetical protein